MNLIALILLISLYQSSVSGVATEAPKAQQLHLKQVEIPAGIRRTPEATGSDAASSHIRLVSPMTSVTAEAGKNVQFICDIVGMPIPQYRWLKDGEDVADRARFNVRPERFGSRLKITQLRLSDAGQYRCVAVNSNGTLSTDAQLVVTGQQRPRRPANDDGDESDILDGEEDVRFGKSGGFCQPLRASVCSGYFGRGTRAFVESEIFRFGREQQLMQLLQMIRDVSNETCIPSLMETACRHSFPACAEEEAGDGSDDSPAIGARRLRRQRVLHLCRDDCKSLELGDQCRSSFSRLKASLVYSDSRSVKHLSRLLPNCNNLPSRSDNCEALATLKSAAHPEGCFVAVGRQTGRRCLPPDTRCRPATTTNSGREFESAWCFVETNGAIESCKQLDLCGGSTESSTVDGPHASNQHPQSPPKSPYGVDKVSGTEHEARRTLPELAPIFASLGGVAALALLSLLVVLAVCRLRRRLRSGRAPHWQLGGKLNTAELRVDDWNASPLLSDSSLDLPLTRLRFGEELGDWCFGRAYVGELIGLHSTSSLTPVAIRCLRVGADAATRQRFLEEFRALAEATADGGHPNLARLLGASLRQTPWCTVTELTSGRDLHELLLTASEAEAEAAEAYDCERLSQQQMLHAAAQIACALDYLAGRGFVHRDVAARNVQVEFGAGQLHCRLGDLGQCREAYSADYYRLQVSRGGSSGCSRRLPIRWMPSEAILFGSYSQHSDAYSLGVLIWEIWSFGAQPYAGCSNSAAIDLIRARRLLTCPTGCPARLYGLMMGLWADPAAARLSSGTARQQLRLWHAEELAQLTPLPVPHHPKQPQLHPPSSLTPAGASSSSAASTFSAWLMPQQQQQLLLLPAGGFSSFCQ